MFLLTEQFYWHPILPDPAQPFRRALQPDPPVVCPGFGFDKSWYRKVLNWDIDPDDRQASTVVFQISGICGAKAAFF